MNTLIINQNYNFQLFYPLLKVKILFFHLTKHKLIFEHEQYRLLHHHVTNL